MRVAPRSLSSSPEGGQHLQEVIGVLGLMRHSRNRPRSPPPGRSPTSPPTVWLGPPDQPSKILATPVPIHGPDGDTYVEFMLYQGDIALDRLGVMHHLCLEVPDIERAKVGPGGEAGPEGLRAAAGDQDRELLIRYQDRILCRDRIMRCARRLLGGRCEDALGSADLGLLLRRCDDGVRRPPDMWPLPARGCPAPPRRPARFGDLRGAKPMTTLRGPVSDPRHPRRPLPCAGAVSISGRAGMAGNSLPGELPGFPEPGAWFLLAAHEPPHRPAGWTAPARDYPAAGRGRLEGVQGARSHPGEAR